MLREMLRNTAIEDRATHLRSSGELLIPRLSESRSRVRLVVARRPAANTKKHEIRVESPRDALGLFHDGIEISLVKNIPQIES